ncbi:M15 family metallopeptidase [Providencia alcalifaciens]|uniref:M15 family metallopeptidase n=1 Tax=Providencia alcalifaciens TaxID=126385 RepID=UPI0012B58FFE|nr:M15 family metallopeptidase [Providencia alcalifaciens]MTC14051.1 M15 family peptidase [Providencia alcalifaciens]
MTLREKQALFTVMIAKLILWANERGYQLTFGDAYRTPEQAAANAKSGKGIKNSLHTQRLAVDFNLFKNGVWLTKSTDHQPLGEYWESIGGTWGGRFNDGNHYSLAHNGVK